jgi:AraC-like DNA-binding protein
METEPADFFDNLPEWALQANQSVTYPRTFLETAVSHGASRDVALLQAGLPLDALDTPANRISFVQLLRLLEAIQLQVPEHPIGFESGLQQPLTAHGSLGYALLCAGSPREAIRILERFWHLRSRAVALIIHWSGDYIFFEICPHMPLPESLQEALFSAILASVCQGVAFMTPSLPRDPEIWLQGPEPPGFGAVASRLPKVRFRMPSAGFVLYGDQDWLDMPLPTANPEALAQAIEQCERESTLQEPMDNIVLQVRTALKPGRDGYPDPEELAGQLHLLPRTFRRRLREQGQSYRQLLEEARRRDSCDMLDHTDISVHRIGELLGYTEPANFTRAFRRWSGMTPSQWRFRTR